MNSKVIPILLVLIMLTAAAGVSAEGQAKTGICHLDEYGDYQLISIADRAVQAHIAHGDKLAGTDGLDANCEAVQPPGECTQWTNGLYVILVGSTDVEEISGRTSFQMSDCKDAPVYSFATPTFAIWAADMTEAVTLCQRQLATYGVSETPTTGLYRCHEPE